MNIHQSLEQASSQDTIHHLALGFFDGLHLGHRSVILPPTRSSPHSHHAVLSFQNHPFAILNPDKKPQLITGLPHKTAILQSWGIGHAILIPFTPHRATQSAEDFLIEIATHLTHLQSVHIGPNWRFGHNRRGTIEMMNQWGASHGVRVAVAQPVLHNGEIISSSRIRAAIQKANLAEASAMLGRPVSIMGIVIEGNKIGRTLGFPTANLQTQDECLPPHGVYAGRAILGTHTYHAAIHIGTKPTLSENSTAPSIEAHILDFHQTIYGHTLTLQFHQFLRPILAHPTIEDLRQAIQLDVEKTRNIMNSTAPPHAPAPHLQP